MASQVTCNTAKVSPSATHSSFKSFRSLDEGKSSDVTVRVTRKWEELDFMSTNEVTSVDMVIVDEEGDEMHAIIPKNLIWKFDKKIREGCLYSFAKLHLTTAKPKFRPAHNDKRGFFRCNTSVTALDAYSVSIIPQKFNFTEFEDLESNLANLHLTDVVGYLKTFTNIRVLQREGNKSSRMREITLENLRGSTLKIALWGSAVHQVGNDPIDCESRQEGVLVAVACTFVKSYLGRITLSSTNATKVYQNIDEPSVVDMRLRSSLFRPPRQITLPDKKNKAPTPVVDLDNRKPISQLISAKWDAYNQAANVIMCTATATKVLIESGWQYLACHRCSKKAAGEDSELWCTKCETKVDMPIARFLVRFEAKDDTGSAVFVALDSEVQKLVRHTAAELIQGSEESAREMVVTAFSQLIDKSIDYQITLSSFNMKQKSPNSYTVTRLNCHPLTAVKVEKISAVDEVCTAKKARTDEIEETEIRPAKKARFADPGEREDKNLEN